MAVKIYIVLILDMTLCSLVGGYQRFTSTLKMEAGDFSETLVTMRLHDVITQKITI